MRSFQSKVAFIFLSSLQTLSATLPQVVGVSVNGVIANSFDEFSTLVTSPECWRDAARVMNLDAFNSDVCNWMTSKDQKLLALELARCHLLDLGRSLFEEVEICSRDSYQNNLNECLKHLSSSGETAYTHLRTSIYQLCTQLRQEITMIDYQELSAQLARASAATGKHLGEMLEQQEQLGNIWKRREKESMLYYDELKNKVEKDHLQWKNESFNILSQVQGEKERLLENQYDAQRQFLEEMAQQQEDLIRQSRELEHFRHTMLAPWAFNSESLYECFRFGIQILYWFLRVIGGALVVRLLTFPASFHWLRPYFTTLIFLSGIVEKIATIEWIPAAFEDHNDLTAVFFILLIGAATVALAHGVLARCCSRKKQETKTNNNRFAEGNVCARERELLHGLKEIRRLREQLKAEVYSNLACRTNVKNDMWCDRRAAHIHDDLAFTKLPRKVSTASPRQVNCASQYSIPSNVRPEYMGQNRANVSEDLLLERTHFYPSIYPIPSGLRDLRAEANSCRPDDLLVTHQQISFTPADADNKDRPMQTCEPASETGEAPDSLPHIGSIQTSLEDATRMKRLRDCVEGLEEMEDLSKRRRK